jgi:uncharacterized membrane protein YebE (DUF533 family)
MSAQGLLDQLLRTAQSALSSTGVTQRTGAGGSSLSDLGKGALAGGALGLLLGNKRVRKMGGNFAAYGGAAALGALAFKAYGDWQRSQQEMGAPAAAAPRTLDNVPVEEAETQSRAVLKALVAAAKSDGHIDSRERELIEAELARMEETDPALQRWLHDELAKPLDPADIAAAASSPELAAEMYLASLLVIDDQSFMEKAYLEELAKRMGLDPALRKRLEAQVAEFHAGD